MNKNISNYPEKNDRMPSCDDPIKRLIKKRVILAPMSGITDIPFRLMTKKFGCDLAFTEMIDINGLLHNNKSGGISKWSQVVFQVVCIQVEIIHNGRWLFLGKIGFRRGHFQNKYINFENL